MGDNSFAPGNIRSGYGTFVVQNIANPPKVVRIFNYPILSGQTRDIMAINGVAESDIRSSLLKGELQYKIRSGEIVVIASDVDLLEFNNNQASFLYSSGVATGIQIGIPQQSFVWNEDVQLVGTVDGVNTVFTIPSGVFIYNGYYKIVVYLNGVKQLINDDYTISMSTPAGYDTITFAVAPYSDSYTSTITADYWQVNSA